MVSFGDYRREKFIHGENPVAAALGKCLFDYVFVFPETAEFVTVWRNVGKREVPIPHKGEPGDKPGEDAPQCQTIDKLLSAAIWGMQRTQKVGKSRSERDSSGL